MHTRVFGRTGWQVAESGCGAWGIGGGAWAGADDQAYDDRVWPRVHQRW